MSIRQIAIKAGIAPRHLQKHFAKHSSLPRLLKRADALNADRQKATKRINASAEAQLLLDQLKRILADAEANGAHDRVIAAVGKAQGLVELLARLHGDLASGANVTVAVGVSVEKARESVRIVEEANAIDERTLADRAQAMLEAYNEANPDDARAVVPRLRSAAEGDGPTPG